MKSRLISTILVMLLNVNLCMATGLPYTLNYQGMLTSKAGQPINTPQEISFNLYTTPIGAGLPFWTETLANVPVSNGQLSVTLGTITPLDPSKFSGDTYLGMKVGTQTEMLPRQKMTSVAYAFNAVSALNGIPKGGVIMWTGAVNQVPSGWALCDGTNGTPNLKDRFVVGVGDRFGSGKPKNLTGGEEDHMLTAAEMPVHTHNDTGHQHGLRQLAGNDNGEGFSHPRQSNTSGVQFGISTHTDSGYANLSNAGGGQPHNNLPPYYALAFIMKL